MLIPAFHYTSQHLLVVFQGWLKRDTKYWWLIWGTARSEWYCWQEASGVLPQLLYPSSSLGCPNSHQQTAVLPLLFTTGEKKINILQQDDFSWLESQVSVSSELRRWQSINPSTLGLTLASEMPRACFGSQVSYKALLQVPKKRKNQILEIYWGSRTWVWEIGTIKPVWVLAYWIPSAGKEMSQHKLQPGSGTERRKFYCQHFPDVTVSAAL